MITRKLLLFLLLLSVPLLAQVTYSVIIPASPPGGVGGACSSTAIAYLQPLTGGNRIVTCDPSSHLWVVGGGGGSPLTPAGSTDCPQINLGGGALGCAYFAGGGTANAQTVTLSPAITSLVAGLTVYWLPSNANSDAATLAVNGLTATAIVKVGGIALAAGDLTSSAIAFAVYDGSNFELQNPQTSAELATPPSCLDVGGSHLNFNSTTGTFVCGVTSGGFQKITTSWAVPNITDGACAQLATPFRGASLGVNTNTSSDTVAAAWPPLPTGIFGTAFINADQSVTFRVCNLSGSTATLGTLTFAAVLIKSGASL